MGHDNERAATIYAKPREQRAKRHRRVAQRRRSWQDGSPRIAARGISSMPSTSASGTQGHDEAVAGRQWER